MIIGPFPVFRPDIPDDYTAFMDDAGDAFVDDAENVWKDDPPASAPE